MAMMITRTVKEAGGKLLTVRIVVGNDCVIRELTLEGDFFAFPPENIDRVSEVSRRRKVSTELLNEVLALLGEADIVGISRKSLEDILHSVFQEALRSCRGAVR